MNPYKILERNNRKLVTIMRSVSALLRWTQNLKAGKCSAAPRDMDARFNRVCDRIVRSAGEFIDDITALLPLLSEAERAEIGESLQSVRAMRVDVAAMRRGN